MFVSICYETRPILITLHSVLNEFATKCCKSFPPHLNSASTLPCET